MTVKEDIAQYQAEARAKRKVEIRAGRAHEYLIALVGREDGNLTVREEVDFAVAYADELAKALGEE